MIHNCWCSNGIVCDRVSHWDKFERWQEFVFFRKTFQGWWYSVDAYGTNINLQTVWFKCQFCDYNILVLFICFYLLLCQNGDSLTIAFVFWRFSWSSELRYSKSWILNAISAHSSVCITKLLIWDILNMRANGAMISLDKTVACNSSGE